VLQHALDDVRAARGRLVEVVGEPGIGKSRLARELVRSFDGAALIGRCAAYGEGATFLPLVDALRGVDAVAALAGSDDLEAVATRIAALEGAARTPGTLGESYWAVRRLLEALAAVRPLLLVLDDVHWAEPALLDLVDYVDARVGDTPLRILCLARTELLDSRPAWAARSLSLGPLDDRDTGELVDATAGLEEETRKRIVALAEGNPLYAQQLAAYAAESGKALEPGAMPATIDAVLAGRLGRLDADQRATLQRAAVAGRVFSRGAVAALAPPDLAVDAHLLALARSGFVRALPDPLPGDDAYRFHHGLVRDAAYATLTKEQRADLHERLAAWLDRDGPGDDAIVGYHLEQAALSRSELGHDDDDLAAAAGERLASAGARAWARNDGRAALGLVERALRLLPPGATRAATRFERGVILHTQGVDIAAVEALEQALDEAESAQAPAIELRARLELARLAHARGELSGDELLELAADSIPALTALGDDRGLLRAWVATSAVHSYACRMEAMGVAAAQAFRHARLAGFSGQGALGTQATALVYGPIPVDRALAEAGSLLEQASDRAAVADVEAALAALHAMSGATDEARRLAGHARALYDDVGALPLSLHANLAPLLMEAERFAGDLDAVVSLGNESVDALLGFGAKAHAATRALQVADAELSRDNEAEATRLLRIAQANAVPNDVLVGFLGGAIEARLLARTGKSARAGRLAADASRLAATTDALVDRVRVAVAAEEVARLGGDGAAARAAAAEADRLRGAKGVRGPL
jgi:predicted ATPase